MGFIIRWATDVLSIMSVHTYNFRSISQNREDSQLKFDTQFNPDFSRKGFSKASKRWYCDSNQIDLINADTGRSFVLPTVSIKLPSCPEGQPEGNIFSPCWKP